jgi:type I restriction enzyme S subunit
MSASNNKWPIVRLGDYADTSLGKMLDAQKNKGTLYPYLGNSNVRWGTFDLHDLALMRFQDDEVERYSLRYGDLVICEGGEPGRCAIWRDEVPDMRIQKALHRVRSRGKLDNIFLYYYLSYASAKGILEPFFTGTTKRNAQN